MLLLTGGIIRESPFHCYYSGYEKKAWVVKNPEDAGYFRQIAEPAHRGEFRLFLTGSAGRLPWSFRQFTARGKHRFVQDTSLIEHKTLHMPERFPAKDIRLFMKQSGGLPHA